MDPGKKWIASQKVQVTKQENAWFMREINTHDANLRKCIQKIVSGKVKVTEQLFDTLGYVLSAYRRVMHLAPNYACEERIPEKLYKLVKLCLVTCLKNENCIEEKEFQLLLDEIISYYQYLILGLYGEIEDLHRATAENYKLYIECFGNTKLSPILKLTHDFHISVGGIMKILAAINKFGTISSKGYLKMALKNYHKAWVVYYGSAIPMALIAGINVDLKNNLEALYWYMLSLGCSFVPQWAKTDLFGVLNTKTFDSNENIEKATVNHLMNLVLITMKSLGKQPTISLDHELIQACEKLTNSFSDYISERVDNNKKKLGDFHKETMMIAVLDCLFYYLNKIFAKSDNPTKRHRVRLTQVIITLPIFTMLEKMLLLLVSVSNNTKVINDSYFFEAISLASFCLSTDDSQIKVFKSYNAELTHIRDNIDKVLLNFCKALSVVGNVAFKTIKNESMLHCLLPEDAITLGLKQMRIYYKSYTANRLREFFANHYVNSDYIFANRLNRVVSLANYIAENFPDLFTVSHEEKHEKYIVYDDKKKQIDATNYMKALTTEKLKEQTKSLRSFYKRAKPNIPTVVVTAECYVNHLNTVKGWVNSGQIMVVIPSCIMNDLEHLGKSPNANKQSIMEASKYIESITKRKIENVRTQKPNEKTVIWDNRGVIKDFNFFVPKQYRDLMEVSLYYKKVISFMSSNEKKGSFAIITDSPSIANIATKLNFNVYDFKKFSSTIKIYSKN